MQKTVRDWVPRFLLDNPLITSLLLIAVAVCIRLWMHHEKSTTLSKRLRKLRKKIYSNWQNNPTINVIRIQKEYTVFLPEQNNAEVYVKLMSQYPTKDSPKPSVFNRENPFLSPFPEGNFIDELSPSHSLIYNSNSLLRCHCLVITKEFQPQNSPLNERDFEAALMTMKAIRGFIFFNSAADAGSSQRHKHLQVVPYSSFRYGHIPLDSFVDMVPAERRVGQVFTIPQFRFKHAFYAFPQPLIPKLTSANLGERTDEVTGAYRAIMERLGNADLKIAHNLIVSSKWIFAVLRRQETARGRIKINAIAFTGSYVIRDDKDHELINPEDPFDILLDVTFPLKS